jgi:hypothetical protein
MIKTLIATAGAALIAAALAVLPGFSPQVEASVPHALAKGDRLDIRPARCAEQAWPNLEPSCLRGTGTGSRLTVGQARVVTAGRAP